MCIGLESFGGQKCQTFLSEDPLTQEGLSTLCSQIPSMSDTSLLGNTNELNNVNSHYYYYYFNYQGWVKPIRTWWCKL